MSVARFTKVIESSILFDLIFVKKYNTYTIEVNAYKMLWKTGIYKIFSD